MYDFYVNSNIKFGSGAVESLPTILKEYKFEKIMIVYDSGVKAAGIGDLICQQAESAAVKYVVFDEVIPNPTNEIVEAAAVIAKSENVDGFVAVGGGSSIDLAKAVNVLMTNPGEISNYAGINNVKNKCLPLIAIPTTAGTSSEITNVSALIDTKKVVKYVVIDNKIMASDIIIDPKLTMTMPQSVTAATGMDAITHAIESYISNMATPLTEYNSLKGLELLYSNIRKAVFDGNDLNARENMMLGCVITGFGFSNANLGLVHAIAHTLSAHFNLPHGMANAAVLPYVVEYNGVVCPGKIKQLANAMGILVSEDDSENIKAVANQLKQLCKDIKIKTLSEQNISRDAFEMIAEEALKEAPLMFNPRQDVTKEDIMTILDKAY